MINKTFIAVIGESHASSEIAKMAEEIGQEIGRAGAVLVCGGLKGVMEHAAKGAKSAGGTTIGILPGSRREDANPYVDYPIITGIGYARNKLVVKTGHVVIAIGGSYGTLSEIGFALGYKIPVVGLNTWQMIHHDGQLDKQVHRVNTAKEAVVLALKLAREARPEEPREFRN
ncbi:TIGR00725 family protein [candidate division WOR-1 bacterium RIFOXYA12_FULL_52_29]|uniref:TIGR00725 family protein n=1 Tax=candidate division WOR-1 bacterium RIFOXYC12_FULL_54_18 TaxID=1802584 RepID=A0A1F4T7Z9_UNCSA|nr:MAG: TIGR00725 family protein [candidate division WOR-1 bacterium RIFOXYA2_FULL_51_19]OGC18369.1 MAG: TIGR00725 family protein [candidate division WOR-1 bacterium RIFOXYA12_FULL_52_29]OGC27224.1 MAG: TIGR00725 family protein [candidate division WOR-1 bacterium RIFOXYB2_FULL_45_9]OGC28786.1 MAG: TIGR00725 family protein [candidate division WOR-1 bacterium RIFOXYC12_FULL_54_18]OGC30760.1 MAG: TIGR00725 family protein [candidate division WOR-1 bacterium RIFOXYB12_FULL_52_16]